MREFSFQSLIGRLRTRGVVGDRTDEHDMFQSLIGRLRTVQIEERLFRIVCFNPS